MTPTRAPLILIIGPTAVGKTEIAIHLAQVLDGEIVSADSRLFYRGMDIGTAKPTKVERRIVPHHLIDIVDPDQTLSLAVFQQKAREVIADIRERGKLPLLVGGTGQYVRAVTEGWKPPDVHPDPMLRLELENIREAKGGDWLHERLKVLDPQSAAAIDPRNVRRTIRAMEVIFATGRRFSEQRERGEPLYRLTTLGLMRPRPELYARIDARIEGMFEAGLLDEVRGLLESGLSPDLPAISAIGYRECVRVIRGEMSIEEAKTAMRRATRVYVRRQSNWFKEGDANIRWFNAGQSGVIEDIAVFIRESLHEQEDDSSAMN